MNKTTKSVIAVLAIGFAAMTSCKKSSSPSATDNLTGSNWKVLSVVSDTNRNGVQDAGDWTYTDTSWAHETIKFNSNGTVVTTQYGVASTAQWAFVSNNTYIKLTDTTGGTTTISSYYVQTLTSTSLIIKDTATSGGIGYVSWENFGK